MTLSPRLRRTLLTAHVVSSVGWLGAIAATLALAIAGVASDDAETARTVYPAMELIGWSALVPLSVASLITGLIQALTSKWGLLRHYWVVTKLLINLVASVVLLAYMQTLGSLAGQARDGAVQSASPVLHAGAATALLTAAVVLSIFKPAGLTRYGWRRQQRATR